MPYITKRRVGTERKYDKNVAKFHNNKWNVYYQNKTYKKLRDWYMGTHLICEECAFKGISKPAEHLHHRKPISTGKTKEERLELLLDWEHNFEAVCAECHKKIHNQLKHNMTSN